MKPKAIILNKIAIGYSDKELANLIKQLLSLDIHKRLVIQANDGKVVILFTGDIKTTRMNIRDWLNMPERKIEEESRIILPYPIRR